MPAFQILHNPQCSKSRACLQLLNEHGVVPDVRVTGLADPDLSDEQLLHGIAKAPALMQRPIVIVGDRALVCRPPERVVSLL